jgi:hypothetical protein
MEREGVRMREPLDGKRDRNAPPADGDDETRPWRLKRRVCRDGVEKARRRDQKLKRGREKLHRSGCTHAPQAQRQADSFGHGDPLRLHAGRAVGDNPGFAATGALLGGGRVRERPRPIRDRLCCDKISGTICAQFLFDSFVYKI